MPQQQQQKQQPQYAGNTNSNGFDRSKIMGFQSKQTNELAMNLLKAQGLMPGESFNMSSAPAANFVPSQPAMPMSGMIQSAPNRGATQGIMPTPATGGWPWKVGDLCLAKYWDDGMVS